MSFFPPKIQKDSDLQEVVDYVSENTGWNASLSNMANVADNIMNIVSVGRITQ